MMAKPMKARELHHPMIQFLITVIITYLLSGHGDWTPGPLGVRRVNLCAWYRLHSSLESYWGSVLQQNCNCQSTKLHGATISRGNVVISSWIKTYLCVLFIGQEVRMGELCSRSRVRLEAEDWAPYSRTRAKLSRIRTNIERQITYFDNLL